MPQNRFRSLNTALQERFGEKIYKLSLNGGCTCPNRDGTLGTRGCIFCSAGGSGDFASSPALSITEQIEDAKKRLAGKRPVQRYIAYFQAYTNTYAPIEHLRMIFTEAITHPDVAVLSVATRPDCLGPDVLELLYELNQIKPVWVELGLQTIHERTAAFIRRGYKLSCFEDALEKLQLNDASLQFEPETSIALGFGFRCGFLGLLHLEIIQERLEREYNLDLVTTAPGVVYRVYKTNGEMMELTNPSNLPDPSEIDYMEEPMVKAEIMVTTDFIGPIMDLCQERRGQYQGMEYMETTRALLKYHLPLNEIIYDFFDALKSRSRGYASFDYEMLGYERSELVKLDILVNKEEVDALSFIVFEGSAYERGRKMCEKLKEEIPRQLFEIPIQAAIGSKIIARETVRAMRKDVLAKCYGGDISRKRKLLEKQKEGKKRMRQVGNVEIPQKAFMSVLKLDED